MKRVTPIYPVSISKSQTPPHKHFPWHTAIISKKSEIFGVGNCPTLIRKQMSQLVVFAMFVFTEVPYLWYNVIGCVVLVLLAVVLSTTGVLLGMLVMNQPFSIIMTGTGIVALAGIVVNNNIVLIDTYQDYARYMPRIEAIARTAQDRIRPVLLTTGTTMAGLAPMMFGLSLDFVNGGYAFDSPTSLWWKQLATAVVFGLGIATVLTLIITPAMLALRVWAETYVLWVARLLARLSMGRSSRAAQDWALARAARRMQDTEIIWPDENAAAKPLFDEAMVGVPRNETLKDILKQRESENPLRAAE